MRKYRVLVLILLIVIGTIARRGDEEVSQLINDLYRMEQNLNAKLDALLTAEGIDPDQFAHVWPPLVLLNASREVSDTNEAGKVTGVKFTLWYRNMGNDDDVSVVWITRLSDANTLVPDARNERCHHHDSDLWSTSTVVAGDQEYDAIIVNITRLDIMLTYSVEFANHRGYRVTINLSENGLDRKVDTVEILDKGGIVYEARQDPVINLRTSYFSTDVRDAYAASVEAEIVNSKNEIRAENCTRYNEYQTAYDSFIGRLCLVTYSKDYHDFVEYGIKLRLRYSEHVTGFVTFTVDSQIDSKLIKVQSQSSVAIKRQDQAQVYPDGFLKVEFTSLHNAVKYCRHDLDFCQLTCEARGNDLERVTLLKQLPDGETEELKGQYEERYHSHLMRASSNLAIPANVTEENDYTCIVTKKGGEATEKNVHVVYTLPVRFDMNETYFEFTSIKPLTLKAVCTASGYPTPEIEIMVKGLFGKDPRFLIGNVSLELDEENFKIKATGIPKRLLTDSPRWYVVDCIATTADGQRITEYRIDRINDDDDEDY